MLYLSKEKSRDCTAERAFANQIIQTSPLRSIPRLRYPRCTKLAKLYFDGRYCSPNGKHPLASNRSNLKVEQHHEMGDVGSIIRRFTEWGARTKFPPKNVRLSEMKEVHNSVPVKSPPSKIAVFVPSLGGGSKLALFHQIRI